MQIHELTEVAAKAMGAAEYAAVDNGAATRKLNLSDLFIRSGESYTDWFTIDGICTSSGAALRFFVPIAKIITNNVQTTVVFDQLNVRGIKADMSGCGYAAGAGAPMPEGVTYQVQTQYYKQGGVYVIITLPSGQTWGLANNSPVAGVIHGTISFA